MIDYRKITNKVKLFFRKVVFPISLFLLIAIFLINYVNNSLILTLKKNYVLTVLTQDSDKILTIHKNMNIIYYNQLLLSNRLSDVESKLKIKNKNKIKSF